MISDLVLAGMMENDIPNTYTSKKRGKPFLKGPKNRQCHQIITIYLSSSRVYRSFTGKRQHLEIRNTGGFAASSSISCTAFHNRHAPATRPVHTRLATCRGFQNKFTSALSIMRYNKLIGGLVRSFRIELLSH